MKKDLSGGKVKTMDPHNSSDLSQMKACTIIVSNHAEERLFCSAVKRAEMMGAFQVIGCSDCKSSVDNLSEHASAKTKIVYSEHLADAVNRSVEISQTEDILLVSDEISLTQEDCDSTWRSFARSGEWTMGNFSRETQQDPSPVVHFLKNSSSDNFFSFVVNFEKVAGHFFSDKFVFFKKEKWMKSGKMNKDFDRGLQGVFLGRKIYQSGDTIRLCRGSSAKIVSRPSFSECVATWQRIGRQIFQLQELFPDSAVADLTEYNFSLWSNISVSESVLEKLKNLDLDMQQKNQPQSEEIARLLPFIQAVYSKTISESFLTFKKSIRLSE